MKRIADTIANDRGSALVIALLVLVLLTLMGISATTTSTIEVQMAGNEKFHDMAFYAAESGWQRSLNWLDSQYPAVTEKVGWDEDATPLPTFSPGEKYNNPDPIVLAEDNDTEYSVKIEFVGTRAVPGYGTNFRRFNYQVDSTGIGPGNARSEVRVVAGKIFDTEG
ncbi:MAG: pilus assembly PilX N-terminal domain-containing protein [Deltaproteobacteria bacterium]|jgi:hypothetical protein|nr:pilus assembly PilX N-terminal domain-containing protein [Deltaproteobacteria bacterium]